MRRAVLLGVCVMLASALPVVAGEVYVPFATSRTDQGVVFKTKVWVTNTGAAPQQISTAFIDNAQDGTKVALVPGVTVQPKATVLLSSVAPEGKSGLLRLQGHRDLVVAARLEMRNTNGTLLFSAEAPTVAAENAFAAGSTVNVQGLERSERGSETAFAFQNLSAEPMSCQVSFFRTDGTIIVTVPLAQLKPLAHYQFDKAMQAIGVHQIADARAQVTCDKTFFVLAAVHGPIPGETAFVLPSRALETNILGGGGGPGPTPANSLVFEQDGVFLSAKNGDSVRAFDLTAAPVGQRYERATIDFDVSIRTYNLGPRNFYGVHAFRRASNDRHQRILFYGLISRVDRTKTIIDKGVEDDVATGNNGGPWGKGNFHIRIVYDVPARRMTFQISKNGTVVETVSTNINHTEIMATASNKLRVDFGQSGVGDGAYFPPVGWIYSNLRVQLDPVR
jgi:hypothetical protein